MNKKYRIPRSIEENECPDQIIMPAGKYRGVPMRLVPSSYLHWVAENWREESICVAADKVWNWREKYGRHFEEEDL